MDPNKLYSQILAMRKDAGQILNDWLQRDHGQQLQQFMTDMTPQKAAILENYGNQIAEMEAPMPAPTFGRAKVERQEPTPRERQQVAQLQSGRDGRLDPNTLAAMLTEKVIDVPVVEQKLVAQVPQVVDPMVVTPGPMAITQAKPEAAQDPLVLLRQMLGSSGVSEERVREIVREEIVRAMRNALHGVECVK